MPSHLLRRIVHFIYEFPLCLGLNTVQFLGQPRGAEVSPRPALGLAVHPRRNVDEFHPVQARFVRFTILKTSGVEPCIDELEIYSAGPEPRNVALASTGARASGSASRCLERRTGCQTARFFASSRHARVTFG